MKESIEIFQVWMDIMSVSKGSIYFTFRVAANDPIRDQVARIISFRSIPNDILFHLLCSKEYFLKIYSLSDKTCYLDATNNTYHHVVCIIYYPPNEKVSDLFCNLMKDNRLVES